MVLDCPVEDFAQEVQSQHSFIAYGDVTDEIEELCRLLGVKVVRQADSFFAGWALLRGLRILGDAKGAA